MKKSTTLGVGAMVALIAVLALLGLSAPAQAYPEARVDLSVNTSVVYSGQDFTATASSNVKCDWTLEWDHKVRKGASASDFQTTYTAPEVTKRTQIPLHGTCSYDAAATASSARSAATWQRTIEITVLPRATAVSAPTGRGGSDLPNTGGPNLLFLAGGLALLLAGATAVSVARRRAEEAETQASGA